jgi:hypothetical protein
MSLNEIITKLTPEQEALIPVYREKWRKIALSTERIDREKAAEAVKAAYSLFGTHQPEIIFCSSPNQALNFITDEPYIDKLNEVYNLIRRALRHELIDNQLELLSSQLSNTLTKKLRGNLTESLINQINLEVDNLVIQELDNSVIDYLSEPVDHIIIQAKIWACYCSCIDFLLDVLKLYYCEIKWDILQLIVKNSELVIPLKNIAFICDRPTKLLFDNQNRLHAEAEPAIEYADGFKVYTHHGIWLPEKYGKLPIQQWQAQWLLEEDNAELRRILIQIIGYERICEELQVIEIHSWHEYTLLRIKGDVDVEPILLLKMTCPSTGHIHILRVPPNVTNAREAIRWVNWGIDPKEFAVQT